MPTEASRVRRYFERVTVGFDRIYDAPRRSVAGWLDRWRRRSMFERYRLALERCGDVRGKRILDIGCGSGRYTVELARLGADVTGIDFSQPMLDVAADAARNAGVGSRCRLIHGDVLEVPLERIFAISLAIGVFDYTADPARILERMRAVTQERLIASFPTRAHPLSWVRHVRLALAGCPVRFYTRRQVARLVRWPDARVTITHLGRDYLATVDLVGAS